MKRALLNFGTALKQFNIHVLGVCEGEEGNSGQQFSKLNEHCKTTDPRGSVKPNLKKHEQNDTKANHDQITENQ